MKVVVNLVMVAYGGRILESTWSRKEFIRFTMVMNVMPTILTFVNAFVWTVVGGMPR